MKASGHTRQRQTRILLATVTADEYRAMDTDGDNRVSPLEFMCRTLIRQVRGFYTAFLDRLLLFCRYLVMFSFLIFPLSIVY